MKKETLTRLLMAGMMAVALIIPSVSGASVNNPDYYALVNALKSHASTIDFKALRIAYTKTEDYQPYGADSHAKDAAFAALRNKNYAEAIKQAKMVLSKNYVDLDTHLLCMIAYREMGDSKKSAFHNAVLKGLVGSLYSSGDGSTPEKAIVVISVSEEYFLLNANRLRKIKSSLVTVDKHNYDRIDVENKMNAQKSVIYFNIDIPYGWLNQHLKSKN